MLGAHRVSFLNGQQAICSEYVLHENITDCKCVGRSGSRILACPAPVRLIGAISRGQRPPSSSLGVDSCAASPLAGRSKARGAVLFSNQSWGHGFSPVKESKSSIRNSASSPVLVASEGPNMELAGVRNSRNP